MTFSEAVDITAAAQLELDFNGSAKAAACATGTNTTTMACSYTVAVGDSAPNGIAIAANTLTGGTIYATGSTTANADLDHAAVAIDAGHKVDGIRPTLVTTGTEAPTTSTDGTQVILTFSEDHQRGRSDQDHHRDRGRQRRANERGESGGHRRSNSTSAPSSTPP